MVRTLFLTAMPAGENKSMIFDSHAHYDDEQFNDDRDALLRSMRENGIGRIVNVGADIASSRASIALAEKYDDVFAAIGVHPDGCREINEESLSWLKKASAGKKVVAIGEIGLDYHYDDPTRAEQIPAFRAQLELAREVSLPVIIHSRDAAADTLSILKACGAGSIGGVIHCFSYSAEVARECVSMGFFIGVGGVITFKNGRKLKEVVHAVPMESIVLETDCPYLSPVPFRGKRNSSLNLPLVAEEIAKIKNMSADEVIGRTYENAMRLYRIEKEETGA